MRSITNHNSWQDLNEHLTTLTTSKKSSLAGTIFENLCKYYLQTAPHYKTKLKKVWLLKEVNEKIKKRLNLPNSDEGIDLIAETVDGKYWAIQCKYRSNPNSVLTVKGDLATFANLAFNHCINIEHGLVLSTSNKPPRKATLLKKIGFESLESFLALDDNDYEGWKFIKAKAEGKNFIPKLKIPRPHQVEAINKSFDYFKSNDRGKIIMPCGTGKSLASFWIARKLQAKSILVAVPSLSLLQQTLKVWTREFLIEGVEPDWLCVCSDVTVSGDLDSFVTNTSDMGFKITTDVTDVKNWLSDNKSKTKIVFTTYQSAKVTLRGAKNFTFDFAILDEAHKTVGHQDKPKALLINGNKIKIKKRLFMTATERLFRNQSLEYLSMDNEKDYGKIIYELSFKKAIEVEPPIISDYKIITYNVEDAEAYELYKSNKFIQIRKEIDDNITAREFVTAIALRKAIKKLGIKNTISFHRSILRANNFKKTQDFISKIYSDYGKMKTFHVSGSMSSGNRASEMRAFSKSTKSLMTNARCLTEGVDLPAVDCVVFTDPKRSKIDIVQAAGRALRLSPGKKYGYILIPLTVSKNDTIEEAAKGDPFDEVATVVGSLSIQDTRISEYLKAISLGKIPSRGSPVDGIISTNVLTKINTEEFKKAVEIKIWEKIARVNFMSYKECKAYAQSLNIKSSKEWAKYPGRLKDTPTTPNAYYGTRGTWEGWREFLDYWGLKSNEKREWRAYEKAKEYALSSGIKSSGEWVNTNHTKIRPLDIPGQPSKVYKEKWEGWSVFLGDIDGRVVRTYRSEWISYDEAKELAQSKNFISKTDFEKRKHELPNNFPRGPQAAYRSRWETWGEFLGTGSLRPGLKTFETYQNMREYLLKNFNLKSRKEFKLILDKLPENFPRTPQSFFTSKGDWKGWGAFLGTGNIKGGDQIFKNYQESKAFIQKLKFESKEDHAKYAKEGKLPMDIPSDPFGVYVRQGSWISWPDYLGYAYLSYNEAKKYAEEKNIKTAAQWRDLSNKKDKKLTSQPNITYKKSGEWKGWHEFLNKEKRGNYVSYEEAKKFANSLNIKSSIVWYDYCKNNKLPSNIPIAVRDHYIKDGSWISWPHFWGKLEE